MSGEKRIAVALRFGKSRKWLYHWIERYHTNPSGKWWEEYSRRPHTFRNATDEQTEQNILLIRKELMEEKMAQTGAISIQYEMRRRLIPVAEIWTINRIIAKHGLK